jgi:hypothetical protein
MGRPIRIANFSGFYGDRATGLVEMLRHAEADVLTGDYLAEVTMSVLAKLRERDPSAGYAAGFLAHLRLALADLERSEARIVVNAGGLNPTGLADAVRVLAPNLNVAAVAGDDLMGDLDQLEDAPDFAPATANAYLGGWGIARALADGARIVVTGRVTDASLVVGAAAWWHGWSREDWDRLAGALIAGHIIECGMQATGGNFSGFEDIDLTRMSFPIAEIEDDGTTHITKLPSSGGAVTVDTVTAQLVYEIQGRWYANPDVVADLASVQVHQAGPDAVTVTGTVGAPPPPATKVALTGVGGWTNSVWIGVTGAAFDQKREVFEQTLRDSLGDVEGIQELHVDLIGQQSEDPLTQNEATGFLRVVASGDDEQAVGRRFSGAIVELALASFPGVYLTAPPGGAKRLGVYRPAWVDQTKLQHRVVDADGGSVLIDPPAEVTAYPPPMEDWTRPSLEATQPMTGPLVEVRLGEVVATRSGDKGGNANVGIWVSNDGRWAWLRNWLTTDRLRQLMPEAADLEIARVELPNLRAINFVIHGLLGEGAISSVRLDSQAKGVGEFLRARRVKVPSSLLSHDL